MKTALGIAAMVVVAAVPSFFVMRAFLRQRLSRWPAVGLMVLSVFAGVLALVGVLVVYDYADLRLNYTRVEGRVTAVEPLCAFERKRYRRRGVDREESEPMPCGEALAVAGTEEFRDQRIIRLRRIRYSYTSPVDGRPYEGSMTVKNHFRAVAVGEPFPVAAHKERPAESKYDRF